jgi:hypothetical protein
MARLHSDDAILPLVTKVGHSFTRRSFSELVSWKWKLPHLYHSFPITRGRRDSSHVQMVLSTHEPLLIRRMNFFNRDPSSGDVSTWTFQWMAIPKTASITQSSLCIKHNQRACLPRTMVRFSLLPYIDVKFLFRGTMASPCRCRVEIYKY